MYATYVIRISTLLPQTQKDLGLITIVFSVELAGFLMLVKVSTHMQVLSYTGDLYKMGFLHLSLCMLDVPFSVTPHISLLPFSIQIYLHLTAV